jgi:hypothetical protein
MIINYNNLGIIKYFSIHAYLNYSTNESLNYVIIEYRILLQERSLTWFGGSFMIYVEDHIIRSVKLSQIRKFRHRRYNSLKIYKYFRI